MSAEIHETTMTGGMASMTEVEEIELPARDRQTLAPGGYHVMLLGLAKPLAVGEKVALTLDLAKGPDVTVKAVVKQ